MAKKSPVSQWRAASDAWMKAFDAAMPNDPRVQRRKMFGYPAAFVNGNMAAGLHQGGLILRLPEHDRQALIKQGGVPFEPMPGRVMKEYIVAPENLADRAADLRQWLQRSVTFASSLPPKKKKKMKTRKKA